MARWTELNNPNTLICRDVDGKVVEIDLNSLGNFLIFGLELSAILELRYQYLKRGGPFPISKENIQRVFNG